MDNLDAQPFEWKNWLNLVRKKGEIGEPSEEDKETIDKIFAEDASNDGQA